MLIRITTDRQHPESAPRRIFAALAFLSGLYILFHLPASFASRSAVAAASLVCLVGSASELLHGTPDFFIRAKTMQRVIQPTCADIQLEIDAALTQRNERLVIWVILRGAWSLGTALLLVATRKALERIWKISGLG